MANIHNKPPAFTIRKVASEPSKASPPTIRANRGQPRWNNMRVSRTVKPNSGYTYPEWRPWDE